MTDSLEVVGSLVVSILAVTLVLTGTAVAAPVDDGGPSTQDDTGVHEDEVVCTPTAQCVIVGIDAGVDSDDVSVDAQTGASYFDSTGQQTNAVGVEGAADADEISADAGVCYEALDGGINCLG